MKLIFESWRQYLNETKFIDSILEKDPYPFSKTPKIEKKNYEYAVEYTFYADEPEDSDYSQYMASSGRVASPIRYDVSFEMEFPVEEDSKWSIAFNTRSSSGTREYTLTHQRNVPKVMSTIVRIIKEFINSEARKGDGIELEGGWNLISSIRSFSFSGTSRDKDVERRDKVYNDQENKCNAAKEEKIEMCLDSLEDHLVPESYQYLKSLQDDLEDLQDDPEDSWKERLERELAALTQSACDDVGRETYNKCLESEIEKKPIRMNYRTKLYIELLRAAMPPGTKVIEDPSLPNNISFTLPPESKQEPESL